MKRHQTMILCLSLLMLLPMSAAAGHPALLEPLTRDSVFPRFTPEQLAENGYPDHHHRYFYPGYTVTTDEQGKPYGIGTICRGNQLLDPEGLEIRPGWLGYGPFALNYNQGYEICNVSQFLELSDMALRLYADLLDLEPVGFLDIVNPDNVAAYSEQAGYGTWRMFKLDGEVCIVQPIPVLMTRTLISHAAIDMVGQWLLRSRTRDLPEWFINGLTSYIGEQGNHYLSYLFQYRDKGPVIMRPEMVEQVLASPPHMDAGHDKQNFRTARYSAFLMMWQLIEERGGLQKMRAMLAGRKVDDVCREVYGVDLATLTQELNPMNYGEPIGESVTPISATRPPALTE
jgi:hypothetical protein